MPPRTTRIGSRFLKASTNPSPVTEIAAVAQSVRARRDQSHGGVEEVLRSDPAVPLDQVALHVADGGDGTPEAPGPQP
jgi:hypothetical protein